MIETTSRIAAQFQRRIKFPGYGSPPKKIYQPAYEWATLIAHRTDDVPEDEVEP